MSRNGEAADLLEEFADLLEAKDVEYKPRAYRRAAQNVREYPEAIEDLLESGPEAFEAIDGVGEAIAEKLHEYLKTGSIAELEALREEYPVDMEALTAVEGVGPKTVATLYDALGITTLDELEAAAQAGDIQSVAGFGPKTEANILENIPFARETQQRELLGDARPLAEDIMAYVGSANGVEAIEIAGSLRRWKATIGDIDILVGTNESEPVLDHIQEWARLDSIIEAGASKAAIISQGIRIDLRFISPDEFGAALQYFTGSKDHNVHLRQLAIDRGLKINEYGCFDVSDIEDTSGQRAGKRIAGIDEASMYEALELPVIPPELREDRGEIEAAQADSLPEVLDPGSLCGDLHVHTDASDGVATIAEMAAGAADYGHDYIAITDHASGPGVVGNTGLDDAEITAQQEAITTANEEAPIAILAGIETNITADGGLSTSQSILEALDVVIASPHSNLNQDRKEATERLITAIETPEVDILGHPSGRLLNRRAGLEYDVDAVIRAAGHANVALECNANPNRLDIPGSIIKRAVEADVPIAINTDAHRIGEYANERYGVHTARRGWARTADVINAWSLEDLSQWLDR